jgi:hypothetical protein
MARMTTASRSSGRRLFQDALEALVDGRRRADAEANLLRSALLAFEN